MGEWEMLLIVIVASTAVQSKSIGGLSDWQRTHFKNKVPELQRGSSITWQAETERIVRHLSEGDFTQQQRKQRNEVASDQEQVWEKQQNERQEELRKFQKLIEQRVQQEEDKKLEQQQQPAQNRVQPTLQDNAVQPSTQANQSPPNQQRADEETVTADWSTYGEDPTQVYKFETTKQSEISELLDKNIVIYSRKLNPYGGLTADDLPLGAAFNPPSTSTVQIPTTVTITIAKSTFNHFVVFILFASIYIKFVLFKKHRSPQEQQAQEDNIFRDSLQLPSQEQL